MLSFVIPRNRSYGTYFSSNDAYLTIRADGRRGQGSGDDLLVGNIHGY
jgi:hypothetical protein